MSGIHFDSLRARDRAEGMLAQATTEWVVDAGQRIETGTWPRKIRVEWRRISTGHVDEASALAAAQMHAHAVGAGLYRIAKVATTVEYLPAVAAADL